MATRHTLWTCAALLIALVGVAGSVWLSVGLKLRACPLCLYQRAFLMAAAGTLLIGLLTSARRTSRPALLALPAAVAGFGVAVFHVSLELRGALECPAGLFSLGTAPRQSLAVFALLLIVLTAAAYRGGERVAGWTAAAIGVVFAAGTIWSAPPMPAPPAEPYTEPITVCRPPFQPLEEQADNVVR